MLESVLQARLHISRDIEEGHLRTDVRNDVIGFTRRVGEAEREVEVLTTNSQAK